MAEQTIREREKTKARLYQVLPFGKHAHKIARVGGLFQTDVERARVLSQLRLLKHWPPPLSEKSDELVGFEVEEIQHKGVKFLEIKFTRKGWLSHNGNLRVFAWVDEKNRTIWIVDGYWKKVNGGIEDYVKRAVARRVNYLRSWLQDTGRA